MTVPERLAAALADRYRIERELGGGGMSHVFLAREQGLDREVVIKVLARDVAADVSLERFEREIQLAASLQQANIVPLLAAGNADGVPYYTMPFVRGESLRGRLAQGPPLTIPECVGILRDVARALSYAHARGVVHRDIKPDNVLLSHGAAVVTDFGIAKAVSASLTASGQATLTHVGTSIGTPTYMAPEQVAGDPEIDHRADLYAWGCLAYELLAGEPPFVRSAPHQVLAAHIGETPVPIASRRPGAPAGLAGLVTRCLAKDPGARPESAEVLLRELETVSTPGSVPAAGTPAPARRRVLAGAAVIVAVLAVGAVLLVRTVGLGGGPAGAAPDRSIAVLPLANLSGNPDDDYFGIGLAEEMTRALSKAGMRVIGRTSAGALRARGMEDRSIARELGVGALLTGSVQRAAGQVRIRVVLSAADGVVRWSQAYDRPLTNVFAVQDEIAREVARELLGSLGAPAAGTLVGQETADPEAHALLLQGTVLWNRRTGPMVRQAIGLLEQAVARDPGYARAHGWLAVAYSTLPWYDDGEPGPHFERALVAAERALAIDSAQAEAWSGSANALMGLGRLRESDARFREAIRQDSTFATAWGWHSLLAGRLGDFDEAWRRALRGVALEPASLITRVQVAQALIVWRRFAEADSVASRVIAADSSFTLAWMQRAEALVGLGRAAEAARVMAERVAGRPGPRRGAIQGTHVWVLARADRTPEARQLLDQVRAAHGGQLPPVGDLAAALAALGDLEGGLMLLDRAIAAHDPWLAIRSRSSRFDPLRADPRGRAMLERFEALR